MQSISSLLRSTVRIAVLRGSPERIQLASQTLPLSLLAAVLTYAGVHLWFLQLSSGQIALSVFCFVSMLAVGMAWLTRYVPRRRLGQVLVAMLLMSAMAGAVLMGAGLLPEFEGREWLAAPVVALLLYGLSHALGYALKCHQLLALCWCLAFAGVVYGLYALLDQQLNVVFALGGRLGPLQLWV